MMKCPNHIGSSPQVYVQLENLSQADPPYKSVAALNCVILGCANIWDIDRAYETFVAIKDKFELTPDIHSYNALLCAFGKKKRVLLSTWSKYLYLCSVFDLFHNNFLICFPFCISDRRSMQCVRAFVNAWR